MKRFPTLFLALGAAAALLLCAWLFLFSSTSSPSRGARPEGEQAARAADHGAASLARVADEEPAPAPAAAAPAAEEREAQAAGARAQEELWAAGEVLVHGFVELAPGLPTDPELRVVALAEELEPRRLHGSSGIFAGEGPTPGEDGVLSVADVGADGSFQARFPAGTTTGWLTLSGRFLYLQRSLRVELPSAGGVRLVPLAGGYLHGKVVLPAGVGAEELAELEVELSPDAQQFSMLDIDSGWMFGRESEVDDQGRFAFRAVATGRTYEIQIRPPTLAQHTQGDLRLEPGRELFVEVPLLRGAVVAGRVVDEAGRAVPDADVRAVRTMFWGFPAGESAEEESGEDGSFVLAAVPPGKARVLASKDGFLQSVPLELELADEERRTGVELVLETGASVGGTVRWEGGGPAAGVEVEVDFDPAAMMGMAAMNAARGAEGEARTDEAGRFVVTGLGKGPFQVGVQAEDAEGRERRARTAGVRPGTLDVALELKLLPSFAGRVVDSAGAPVTRFHVRANAQAAIFWMPGENVARDFEDPEGRFLLEGLVEGSWDVTVSAEGHGPSHPLRIELPEAPGTEPTTFVLRPAAAVAGFVQDASGEPVAGAKVAVTVESTQAFARLTGSVEAPEALSDEQGAFLLAGLTDGACTLVARHSDHAESEAVAVELVAGETLPDVVLRLRTGGILTGLVFDAEGEPAGGTSVFVQDTSTWETVTSRTDEEGTFRVESLRPGPWQVSAMLSAPGAAAPEGEDDMSGFLENLRFQIVEIAEGEETHVVLGAPPEDPVRVTGHVLHAGRPTAGTLVSFLPEESTGFSDVKMTRVDEQGAYSVQLAKPGPYLVQVQRMGEESSFSQSNVEFAETIPAVEQHELDLELPVGAVSGRVTDERGDPLPEQRVTLTTDGGIAYGTLMGGQYAESMTDAAGRYRFEFLRPGEYTVSAGGSPFGGAFGTQASHGRVVRGGLSVGEGDSIDGIDFRLPASGDISGRVVGPTGSPVAGAAIFVRDASGKLLERFTMINSGPDGSFRTTGIAPGRYTVQARSSELVSESEEWVEVRPKETATARVVLGQGTILLISVEDETGGGIQARISVTDSRGREVNGMIAYSDLLSGGGFSSKEQRLGPLPPDRYEVVAVADDGRTAKKPVHLTGQGERRLKIRLR